MITATPAPKPTYAAWVGMPYFYALVLVVLVVVGLMGIGGFDFASINYTTPGIPAMAVVLAGMAIYALPFLVRLHVSLLARYFSALFSITFPLFLAAYVMYVGPGTGMHIDWLIYAGTAVLVGMAAASFIILDGPKALRFSKK